MSDDDRATEHAAAAEDLLDQAPGTSEQLALQLLTQAATHAALATYYELRAQRPTAT